MTLTIIAYRREIFFGSSMRGALAQTYPGAQPIVWDHCSPNRSFEMMKFASDIEINCEQSRLSLPNAFFSKIPYLPEELGRQGPRSDRPACAEQITLVKDSSGHARWYAIDPSMTERPLGWRPEETFETGLPKSVAWYVSRQDWWRPLRKQRYAGERLGRGAVEAAG